jgi:hypothetical protein
MIKLMAVEHSTVFLEQRHMNILVLELRPEVLRTVQDKMTKLMAVSSYSPISLKQRPEVLRTFQDRMIELVAEEYLLYSWM